MTDLGDSALDLVGLRSATRRASPAAKAPMIIAEPHRSASQAKPNAVDQRQGRRGAR